MGATERDEFLRAAWRALVAGEIYAERLVFVDEMGVRTPRLCTPVCLVETGRAGVCERAAQLGSERHLAGEYELERERDGSVPGAVEGSTTKEVFEAYLERVLAPPRLGRDRSW